jgi:peptidoglycan/LPS O-acetylase OafA/YrhL
LLAAVEGSVMVQSHLVSQLGRGPHGGRETIVNVQVLRALAAAMVVFYHLQAMVNTAAGTRLRTHFGASGVDIFFVVSGFVMFQTTRGFRRSTLQFWIDRVVRIVPLYWLATALLVAIYLTGRHPNGLRLVDASDVVTSLFFIPHVRADGLKEPVLNLGWTLIYEMFFYFVFGLTFFLRSHVLSLLVLCALFCGAIVAGVVFAPLSYALNYYTNPIVLEFSVGCALSLWYDRYSVSVRSAGGRWARWLGSTLVVLGVATIGGSDYFAYHAFQGWFARPLIYGIPATLIVAGALILEKSGRRWQSRPLLLLGAASYALYLIHPMVMQPVTKALGFIAHSRKVAPLLLGLPSVLGGYVFAAIVTRAGFAAALLAGVGVHLWFELPLHNRLRQALKPRVVLSPAKATPAVLPE